MPGFRKVTEEEIFAGAVISVAKGTFASPDGERFEREIVHHPGAVVVVPLAADGTVVLIRQFRAAINGDLLELPAGKRDVAGEDPATTAARELAEEVGLAAGRFDLLARFYNSPGFSDEFSWCYLAQELQDVDKDLQGVEEEHMDIERVALADVAELIRGGQIVDAKTIIGLTLAANAVA